MFTSRNFAIWEDKETGRIIVAGRDRTAKDEERWTVNSLTKTEAADLVKFIAKLIG